MANRKPVFPGVKRFRYGEGMTALTALRESPFAQTVVRQFTPNWFTVTMGTGMVMLNLQALPFDFPGRHALADALWLVDIALYLLFTLLFLGRLILFPKTIEPLLRHPAMSLFLGAIPMGLIPIVDGCLSFGPGMVGTAQALWWFDVVLAVGVALLVPYRVFVQHDQALDRITPLWLLPIVGPEVTASGGALLAPHLAPGAAQFVIAASYVLWAMAVPFAFAIITLVILRYAVHKLPPAEMAASVWLILGPIGTGSLGLLTLGQAAPAAFAVGPLAAMAAVARDGGLLGGLLLWGMGLWWLVIAAAVTVRYIRRGLPFNLGWWGYTFPLGVYTAATLALGRLTGFALFTAVGVGLYLLLAGVWSFVAFHTVKNLLRHRLFHAPCLAAEAI